MKVKTALVNLAVKALAQSLNVTNMEKLAKVLIPDYNLYDRTGFPENIPIPARDAAKQIANDINNLKLFPYLVELFITAQTEGIMGRKYQISGLREIVKELNEMGLIYDHVNKIFVEDSNVRRTRNWGTLREDEEYIFSFLRLDIVGNSELVRKYPDKLIKKTYSDLKDIVDIAIERREGRIWNWEGDGGLVAFYFSHKNLMAILSAMEIVHEIHIYNQILCELNEPLQARISVHNGACVYTENEEELKKNDTIKELIKIEAKFTKPNSVSTSSGLYRSLDTSLATQFKKVKESTSATYYNYILKWEE